MRISLHVLNSIPLIDEFVLMAVPCCFFIRNVHKDLNSEEMLRRWGISKGRIQNVMCKERKRIIEQKGLNKGGVESQGRWKEDK